MEREIRRLPFAWDHSPAEIDEIIETTSRRIAALPDSESLERDLATVLARLPHEKCGAIIYRMLLVLCWTDGVQDAEKRILERVREALRVNDGQAADIAESIRTEIAGDLV